MRFLRYEVLRSLRYEVTMANGPWPMAMAMGPGHGPGPMAYAHGPGPMGPRAPTILANTSPKNTPRKNEGDLLKICIFIDFCMNS